MNIPFDNLIFFHWLLLFRLFKPTISGLAECASFSYAKISTPIGSQFCTSTQYNETHATSHYFLCESGVPYRYGFETADCTGLYTKAHAITHYQNGGYDPVYSCNDNTCDYVYYSHPTTCHGNDTSANYSSYRVIDHCIETSELYQSYMDDYDYGGGYYDSDYIYYDSDSDATANYYSWQCDSDTVYQKDYARSDCSGFIDDVRSFDHEQTCFEIHKCSQSISQCGGIQLDESYHVGDVVWGGDPDTAVANNMSEICSSSGGAILGSLLTPLGLSCNDAAFLGSVCNLFDKSSCTELDARDTVVASCWSSNAFSYGGISTADAFQKYLYDEYDIIARYEATSEVINEVYLDNCGRLDNYWIAGVYDSNDNDERNDIVSDVVAYLVNDGVSTYEQKEQLGVKLTDVIRSKRGLLLHYDEMDDVETDYAIYFCEFNVVAMEDGIKCRIHYSVFVVLFLLLLNFVM